MVPAHTDTNQHTQTFKFSVYISIANAKLHDSVIISMTQVRLRIQKAFKLTIIR